MEIRWDDRATPLKELPPTVTPWPTAMPATCVSWAQWLCVQGLPALIAVERDAPPGHSEGLPSAQPDEHTALTSVPVGIGCAGSTPVPITAIIRPAPRGLFAFAQSDRIWTRVSASASSASASSAIERTRPLSSSRCSAGSVALTAM